MGAIDMKRLFGYGVLVLSWTLATVGSGDRTKNMTNEESLMTDD